MYAPDNVFQQQECFKLRWIPERTKGKEEAFDHLLVFLRRGASLQKPAQIMLIYLMGMFLSC